MFFIGMFEGTLAGLGLENWARGVGWRLGLGFWDPGRDGCLGVLGVLGVWGVGVHLGRGLADVSGRISQSSLAISLQVG